jgi:spoIIIJ-associated protein
MQPNDLNKITTLLSFFDITQDQINVTETEELVTITVDLDEAAAGRLIGRFATTLDSLQLLISLMINQGEVHRHVLLDVAGYRERRLGTLQSMVENAKNQADSTGMPTALPPLSATERRQVHLMLKGDEAFTSFSEGMGQDRRLFIAPQNR